MIVLDTNVISELMQTERHPAVQRWVLRQSDPLWITAVSVMEIRYGILALKSEAKRRDLASAFDDFRVSIPEGVLPFDGDAAAVTASFLIGRQADGRRLDDFRDATIAGTVLSLLDQSRDVRLATRNVKDFAGVPTVNPWDF